MELVAFILTMWRGVVLVAGVLFFVWSLLYLIAWFATADSKTREPFLPEYSKDPWGWRATLWTPAAWLGLAIAFVGWYSR